MCVGYCSRYAYRYNPCTGYSILYVGCWSVHARFCSMYVVSFSLCTGVAAAMESAYANMRATVTCMRDVAATM